MASYINAEFDSFGFKWYCKDLLDGELLSAIKEGLAGIKYWSSPEGGYIDQDMSNIESTKFTVGTINAKAFIQEYGSGKYIKTSNPGFDEYRTGSYWNPARKSNWIVGRPAGTYTLPNWKTGLFEEQYTSKGRMEGRIIPFNQGKKSEPKIDIMLKKIYLLFLSKVENNIIPKVQRAIDSGKFIVFKTVKC